MFKFIVSNYNENKVWETSYHNKKMRQKSKKKSLLQPAAVVFLAVALEAANTPSKVPRPLCRCSVQSIIWLSQLKIRAMKARMKMIIRIKNL